MEMTGYWKILMETESQKPYFQDLFGFLETAYETKKVHPEPDCIFKALELTPYEELRVVILGQDPYHGRGQANGLAFSVPQKEPCPPSLRNILKELYDDADVKWPEHGDLTEWARQGVLLLNSTLTVEEEKPGSHQNKGWETFTDEFIRASNEISDRSLIFVLWGNYAQSKARLIDGRRHLVLKAAHPSPLSAHNGFFKCKHFSTINSYLTAQGKKPIIWGNVL